MSTRNTLQILLGLVALGVLGGRGVLTISSG